ncbi:MAG: DUF3014 domain-containing protein [Burkholderiales bacterium]
MPERPHHRPEPPRDRSWGLNLALLLLVLAVALFGWRWWQDRQAAPPFSAGAGSGSVLSQTDEVAPPAPAAAAPAPSGPLFPVEPLVEADPGQPTPPSAPADARHADAVAEDALTRLLGSKAVAEFLETSGFVRRAVATVDNLPSALVPGKSRAVKPIEGRFSASGEGESRTIAPENSARYAPFVRLVESVDAAKLAGLYRKHYALFQKSYEELGYPGRYFNDRLIGVIDHLLQSPEPASPPRVTVVEIKGPYRDPRPWTRYEFADPQLEALSAGQKMMVRMGVENERLLKAKLIELRTALAAGGTERK